MHRNLTSVTKKKSKKWFIASMVIREECFTFMLADTFLNDLDSRTVESQNSLG